MSNSKTEEFDRFLLLFDRLVNGTNVWIERTPKDKLEWLPVDNPNVRFGNRVTKVTIKSLFIHIMASEHQWVRSLGDCADNATVPIAPNPELSAKLESGDFVGGAMKMHGENMRVLGAFTDQQLRKTVRVADSAWSVMDFLWAMYAHRSYHVGNLDIYLRQSDTAAPDFFQSWLRR